MKELAPNYFDLMLLGGLLFLTWEGIRELAKLNWLRSILNLYRRIGKPMSIVLVSLLGVVFANVYWWLIQAIIAKSEEDTKPPATVVQQASPGKTLAESVPPRDSTPPAVGGGDRKLGEAACHAAYELLEPK